MIFYVATKSKISSFRTSKPTETKAIIHKPMGGNFVWASKPIGKTPKEGSYWTEWARVDWPREYQSYEYIYIIDVDMSDIFEFDGYDSIPEEYLFIPERLMQMDLREKHIDFAEMAKDYCGFYIDRPPRSAPKEYQDFYAWDVNTIVLWDDCFEVIGEHAMKSIQDIQHMLSDRTLKLIGA